MSLLGACTDKAPNSNANVRLEDYEAFGEGRLSLDVHRIRKHIDSLARNDRDGLTADSRTRKYYRSDGAFLWVSLRGLSHQADTLLSYLSQVGDMGFSPSRFRVPQIEHDLACMRALDVDGAKDDINRVAARLEYNLTKAYLRYSVGQRFGYMNPNFIFNRVDTLKPNKPDTLRRAVRYRGLFDVKMDHADDAFYRHALSQVGEGTVGRFLREIQPSGDFYRQLAEVCKQGGGSKAWRAKVMCNMERTRWREADRPWRHKQYVLVNLPSFHLMAIDGDDTLSMRIGCGSLATKTPLLTSAIKRMDVNPRWVVPRSIIEKDMIHYFSRSYCERRGFYLVDRNTGKEVPMADVSAALLHDPRYAVVQRGGKGNSLGRLIFRFDNNFAVYLHDTSSRDVFSREDRGVSHGCVRVEKPLELAKFMLKDRSEQFLDDLEYCMTSDSLSDKSRVINSIKLERPVPLFITYYTLYPMAADAQRGSWREYPDVYGYDKVIYEFLKKNYQ